MSDDSEAREVSDDPLESGEDGVPSFDPRIERMIESGESLPNELETEIVESSEDLTDELVAVLTDEELAHGQAPGEGWAPAHAAHLLAKRDDREAIEPMVELLQTCEPGEALHPELIDALQSLGDAAFEPVLEALQASDDRDARSSMLEVATHLGVEDEALYREAIAFFRDDPEIGAGYLANYGDDRALDVLCERLDATDVDTSGGMLANQDIIEIGEAIQALGGDPDDHLIEKIRLVKRRRRRSGGGLGQLLEKFGGDDDSPEPAETSRDIGRNEPCWCGSGDKYKHCHWREDRRGDQKRKK